MHEAGSNLLAGTALAQDHHRGVGGRGPAALFHLLQHGGAARLGCIRLAKSLQTALQRLHFPLQLYVRKRPLRHQKQVFALEGLLQVVEGAIAHG